MAIFVTFKTKDTMKSFFILLSLYCFFVVNVVNGKSVTFPSRVEIIMDEDFDLPDGPGFGAPNFVRWSYATSMENIKEGLDRLEKFLAE